MVKLRKTIKEGTVMPLVHIDLIKDVTAAICKNANVPAERVHIVLNEMQKDRYSVGGKMVSDN
jgi:4-oxalocrotonate tautomerase